MDSMTFVMIAIAGGAILLLLLGFFLEKFGPVGGRSKRPERKQNDSKAAQIKR